MKTFNQFNNNFDDDIVDNLLEMGVILKSDVELLCEKKNSKIRGSGLAKSVGLFLGVRTKLLSGQIKNEKDIQKQNVLIAKQNESIVGVQLLSLFNNFSMTKEMSRIKKSVISR